MVIRYILSEADLCCRYELEDETKKGEKSQQIAALRPRIALCNELLKLPLEDDEIDHGLVSTERDMSRWHLLTVSFGELPHRPFGT